ncbi:hypothetical protein C723_1708 [Christiangramia flava JLT2011]|nr:hypothetical protein C723_1708 [Christiangramia flava JLT2011]
MVFCITKKVGTATAGKEMEMLKLKNNRKRSKWINGIPI